MVLPGALPKTSLTETSSRVQKSNTILASSNVFFLLPFHKIRNAILVDPSAWFRLVTVVVRVPAARLGVSTVYMTEPVSESRMVVLRKSSSSFEVKDRFILRGDLGCAGVTSMGDPRISVNRVYIYGCRETNYRPRILESKGRGCAVAIPPGALVVCVSSTQNKKGKVT